MRSLGFVFLTNGLRDGLTAEISTLSKGLAIVPMLEIRELYKNNNVYGTTGSRLNKPLIFIFTIPQQTTTRQTTPCKNRSRKPMDVFVKCTQILKADLRSTCNISKTCFHKLNSFRATEVLNLGTSQLDHF